MKVHKDCKSLQKDIPKDILPVEYGGTAGTVDQLYGTKNIFFVIKLYRLLFKVTG